MIHLHTNCAAMKLKKLENPHFIGLSNEIYQVHSVTGWAGVCVSTQVINSIIQTSIEHHPRQVGIRWKLLLKTATKTHCLQNSTNFNSFHVKIRTARIIIYQSHPIECLFITAQPSADAKSSSSIR